MAFKIYLLNSRRSLSCASVRRWSTASFTTRSRPGSAPNTSPSAIRRSSTPGRPPCWRSAEESVSSRPWRVGLLLGIPVAIAARAGKRPKRDARCLVGPTARLLVVMGVCALISGIIGFVPARRGSLFLVEPLSELIPLEKHAAFLADLRAHSMSCLAGLVGGLVVIGSVWRSRGRARSCANDVAGRVRPTGISWK